MENQQKSVTTFFIFHKNGSYKSLVYNKVSTSNKQDMIFQDGSVGYYKYSGNHKFDLYPLDVDLSPIIGKSVADASIGQYFNNCMKNHTKKDLDITIPSFSAEILIDAEHLHILQNNKLIIELKKRHIKFGDKR